MTDTATADHMTWDVTDLGFRMGLSPKVPDVLSIYVADLVGDLLSRHGLTLADVDGWAVHPGGPRILDVVRDQLELPESALAESRGTLAEHGNCSSPTVLLIIDALRRRPPDRRRTRSPWPSARASRYTERCCAVSSFGRLVGGFPGAFQRRCTFPAGG